jgi:teichuronic acid biosynthesis glycosyltransferase TuaH
VEPENEATTRWDSLVVYFAGTRWDGVRGTDRHVAERLARWIPVLYVDPPTSWLTPLRDRGAHRGGPRLRRIGHNLARLTPLAPPLKTRTGVRVLTAATAKAQVRRAIGQLAHNVHAVVAATPGAPLDVAPARVTAFYATDDFVAGARLMHSSVGWLERQVESHLHGADIVVAVSDALADKWRDKRPDVVVIPNGCDAAHFAGTDNASPPSDVSLPRPIATVIGQLSPRLDFDSLQRVADQGHSLLLVGPAAPEFTRSTPFATLVQLPNVQWVGERPFADMPTYLLVTDVGLVPYTDTEFNRTSFPLKALEYLAAGRACVATDLPAMRWLGTDLVTVAAPGDSFADAVSAQLADPRRDLASARRDFAAEHSWDRRTAEFAAAIDVPLRRGDSR